MAKLMQLETQLEAAKQEAAQEAAQAAARKRKLPAEVAGPFAKQSVIKYTHGKTQQQLVSRVLGYEDHRAGLRVRLFTEGAESRVMTRMLLDPVVVPETELVCGTASGVQEVRRQLNNIRHCISRTRKSTDGMSHEDPKCAENFTKLGELRAQEKTLMGQRRAAARCG